MSRRARRRRARGPAGGAGAVGALPAFYASALAEARAAMCDLEGRVAEMSRLIVELRALGGRPDPAAILELLETLRGGQRQVDEMQSLLPMLELAGWQAARSVRTELAALADRWQAVVDTVQLRAADALVADVCTRLQEAR